LDKFLPLWEGVWGKNKKRGGELYRKKKKFVEKFPKRGGGVGGKTKKGERFGGFPPPPPNTGEKFSLYHKECVAEAPVQFLGVTKKTTYFP